MVRNMRGARAAVTAAIAAAVVLGGSPPVSAGPAVPDARVRAWQTGAIGADRVQHASITLALGTGLGIATREPAAAFGGALAVGIVKELLDARRGGRFDLGDLAADAAGAAGAATLTHALGR